jgi:hypothetical protein
MKSAYMLIYVNQYVVSKSKKINLPDSIPKELKQEVQSFNREFLKHKEIFAAKKISQQIFTRYNQRRKAQQNNIV